MPSPDRPRRHRRDPEMLQEEVAEIARRLLQLRTERNESQEEVAQLVGVTQSALSRWESPEHPTTPSAAELRRLAEHFGVQADWILGLTSYRRRLPAGEALIDEGLLDQLLATRSKTEIERLLRQESGLGTVWIAITPGLNVMSPLAAQQKVRQVDRHIRAVHGGAWEEWARQVLGKS
jgi:transcriptional regulator with XRE-family HTH domain